MLALVIVAGAWGGWRHGFLASAADLLALIASVLFAFVAYPAGVALVEWLAEPSVWTAPLVFIAAYVIARFALGAVLVKLFRRISPRIHAVYGNRLLGIIPGITTGLIDATIIAMFVLAAPMSDGLTRAASESVVVERFAAPAAWLESKLKPIFNPAIDRTLSRLLTVQPESRQTVTLPFKVANVQPRPDLEERMLELVNEERRTQGLRPLKADPEATAVAREHSKDMFARGYFSHINPEGEGPFDRMREGKLRFLAAGENLALARTLPMAHQGLMDSPGHRANILRPWFGRVGIGIVDGGRYGLMVTQNFRN